MYNTSHGMGRGRAHRAPPRNTISSNMSAPGGRRMSPRNHDSGLGHSPTGRMRSSASPGSGGTGSPRDLSPPMLQELANMNIKQLVRRPDNGVIGRPIQLKSNLFEMTFIKGNLMVQRYHVEVQHPGVRKLDKDEYREIFWTLVGQHREIFPNKYSLAYDGSHLLFCSNRIEFPDNRSSMKLEADVHLPRDPRDKTRCAVVFQSVGPVLVDVSKARTGNLDERSLTPIQIIDILLRQALSCPFVDNSANFYPWKSSFYRIPTPGAAMDLGAGRELWTGFFCAAHVSSDWKPLINFDVSHTTFFKAQMPMLQYMCEVLNDKAAGGGGGGYRGGPPGGRGDRRGPPGPVGPYQMNRLSANTSLSLQEWKILENEVKGLKVRISHRPGAVRVYRVNSLRESAENLCFQVTTEGDAGGDSRRISVAQYFAERYGPLRFPKLPCIHVGPPQRHIYFPLEVCDVQWPMKCQKKLTEKQTSQVIKAAAVEAPLREQKIRNLVEQAGFQRDPFLREFGLQMDMRMKEVTGRVLPPPQIQYNEQNQRMYKPILREKGFTGLSTGAQQKMLYSKMLYSI